MASWTSPDRSSLLAESSFDAPQAASCSSTIFDPTLVYCLGRKTEREYISNGLQGARLQVLAQADIVDQEAPSFEEQHVNLRRGDVIGRCAVPILKGGTTNETRCPRLSHQNQPPEEAG